MIEASGLQVKRGGRVLLDEVGLALAPGEVMAVVGPNGAGKSTLLKTLCGQWQPVRGEVRLNGRRLPDWPPQERARRVAVLPQQTTLSFSFTAEEVALLGRTPHVQRSETPRDYEIARAALRLVAAEPLAERLYPTLSGGEQQRVQLARVLAQIWEAVDEGARFLLLDEPTTSLDLAQQHSTLGVARRMAQTGVGVLAILHDLNLAAQYADRVMLLNRGRVVTSGKPSEALTSTAIRETFAIAVTVTPHPALAYPLVIPAAHAGPTS